MTEEGQGMISQPQFKIHVQKEVLIPMRDRVKLAADIYFPNLMKDG